MLSSDQNAGRNGTDGNGLFWKFYEFVRKAQELLGDPGRVRETLFAVWEKLESCTSEAINVLREDILRLKDLIEAYIDGSYRKIPIRTIAMCLGALAYLISPFDAVCDLFPVIGLLDDSAIIALVLKMCHDDLEEFRAWKERQSKN